VKSVRRRMAHEAEGPTFPSNRARQGAALRNARRRPDEQPLHARAVSGRFSGAGVRRLAEAKESLVEDLMLALVQHNSPVGKKAENLAATIAWVKRAKRRGADLVCLPELGLTGHAGHPEMVSEAEPVPEGDCCRRLADLARRSDVVIAAGIAEEDRGVHYNTQFVVGPEGYIGKQRKVHLSRDEYFYFRHGTRLPVLDIGRAKVGIVICYDNIVPETSRCLAVAGAEVLLCPHAARFGAWPPTSAGQRKAVEDTKSRWRMLHRTRAYDNGCYVALCNAAGRAAVGLRGVEANHAGGCMVVDPAGEVVAESRARDIREEMIVVRLEAEAVAARRRQACFNLQTRRPEAFGILAAPTD